MGRTEQLAKILKCFFSNLMVDMIKLEGKMQVTHFTQGNLIISAFVSFLVTLLKLQLQHKNTGTFNFAYFGLILYREEKLLF